MFGAVIIAGIIISSSAAAESAKEILDATQVKGGLIVHIGCGDGRLTAALRANDSYLVHGLDTDAQNVEKARKYIQSLGLYGRVSIDRFDGQRLPYIDNLVNLIVAKVLGDVPMAEVMRVLAPKGVVYIQRNGKWTKTVKPRPNEIDEWTHYLHGPDNNPVADDSIIDKPYHLQWLSGPKYSKDHEALPVINAAVSSGGRIFYIADEAPIALPKFLPAQWALFARDAFNGVSLWKRPIHSWQTFNMPNRHSLPVDLYRRLVAVNDRVYVTLNIFAPVSVLDAATGKTLKVYEGTDKTEEIIYKDGILFLVLGTYDPADVDRRQLGIYRKEPEQKRVVAVDTETGDTLWVWDNNETMGVMPLTLAVGDERVLFQNTTHIFCLDWKTGKELWRYERPVPYARPGSSAPTLIVRDNVVLSANAVAQKDSSSNKKREPADGFVALSEKTGELLWVSECTEGVHAPVDVFVANGLVWIGEKPRRAAQDYTKGRDIHTGEVKKEVPESDAWVSFHHDRCYRDKATERYILASRTGIEFIDLNSTEITPHRWIRGICQYGILPCNGLLYLPPNQCGCFIQSQLKDGFYALAAKRPEGSGFSVQVSEEGRLQKGPAYNKIRSQKSEVRNEGDWPTYRGNPARSGYTKSIVPTKLRQLWKTQVGGKLSSLVCADGKVFVSQVDENNVCCLDADTGKILWNYTAGGRVDSPPTIARGIAVFGCRDGWVYALRASDGNLIWRFRAAPYDRRTIVYDQMESLWPVNGSVLIEDDNVYFAAGRSSFIDGGMYLYKLGLETGSKTLEKHYYSRDQQTGTRVNLYQPYEGGALPERNLPGLLPDIISSDGQNLFMRSVPLDRDLDIQEGIKTHLFCSMGFLDDTWWERTYWIFGEHMSGGARGIAYASSVYPAGRIMVYDDSSVYGYRDIGQNIYPKEEYGSIFSTTKKPNITDIKKGKQNNRRSVIRTEIASTWQSEIPFYVNAMVMADNTLFLAGPVRFDEKSVFEYLNNRKVDTSELPEVAKDALPSFEGKKGSLLWAVNKKDGKKLDEYKLDSKPVWDGMTAANGRLYLSLKNGSVLCLGNR